MSVAAPRPGPRYQALLHLLRTADTLWNASRAFFAQWDLSPSQFNVLNLLGDLPRGLTQIDLSRQLLMHRSNVTGLVDRLEARGLVERQSPPEDRRAHRVVLTPAGQRLIREVLPHFYRAAEEVWGTLPRPRSQVLVADLEQIRHNSERMAADLERTRRRPS